jgi:hypothetical protein
MNLIKEKQCHREDLRNVKNVSKIFYKDTDFRLILEKLENAP